MSKRIVASLATLALITGLTVAQPTTARAVDNTPTVSPPHVVYVGVCDSLPWPHLRKILGC